MDSLQEEKIQKLNKALEEKNSELMNTPRRRDGGVSLGKFY